MCIQPRVPPVRPLSLPIGTAKSYTLLIGALRGYIEPMHILPLRPQPLIPNRHKYVTGYGNASLAKAHLDIAKVILHQRSRYVTPLFTFLLAVK